MYLSLCRPIPSWKLTIFFYLLIKVKVKSHILQIKHVPFFKRTHFPLQKVNFSWKIFVTFCVDCISNNWASKINVLFFLKYLKYWFIRMFFNFFLCIYICIYCICILSYALMLQMAYRFPSALQNRKWWWHGDQIRHCNDVVRRKMSR